jgi:Protein of unknown function (DUF551)
MNWISVKETLPGFTFSRPLDGGRYITSNEVIVATKEGRVFATTYSNFGFANLNSRTDEVTHWMPLPGPPSDIQQSQMESEENSA